jgi:hypothetical protein
MDKVLNRCLYRWILAASLPWVVMNCAVPVEEYNLRETSKSSRLTIEPPLLESSSPLALSVELSFDVGTPEAGGSRLIGTLGHSKKEQSYVLLVGQIMRSNLVDVLSQTEGIEPIIKKIAALVVKSDGTIADTYSFPRKKNSELVTVLRVINTLNLAGKQPSPKSFGLKNIGANTLASEIKFHVPELGSILLDLEARVKERAFVEVKYADILLVGRKDVRFKTKSGNKRDRESVTKILEIVNLGNDTAFDLTAEIIDTSKSEQPEAFTFANKNVSFPGFDSDQEKACEASLEPNQSCLINIKYTPSSEDHGKAEAQLRVNYTSNSQRQKSNIKILRSN